MQNAGLTGGLGESKPVDKGVTELVERLKPDIIKKICDSGVEKCPSADAQIVVNSYKTQTVAGTNYFVGLVAINSFLFLSIRVFFMTMLTQTISIFTQCNY